MRDIAVLLAMFCLIPLAFSSSLVAYLIWGWTAFISLNSYVYGFMGGVPFNMLFALLAMAMVFNGKDPEQRPFVWSRVVILFTLFATHASISTLFAIDNNDQSFFFWTLVLKVVLFCVLMPMVITNRTRIHAMLLTIVLGLALHGTVEGAKFIASGGGHHVLGLLKFGDNNHFAMLIVMTMPLLLYVFQYSEKLVVRLGAAGGLLFAVTAVIGTHSRGGLLSMAVAGAWLVLAGRRKMMGLAVLIAGAVVVIALAPDTWTTRMNTIKEAEEDSSFMGRVEAWKVSSAIALRRPLTGGGFHGVEKRHIWQEFRDSPSLLDSIETFRSPGGRAAHSVYFEVMGDLGFVGLLLFLLILGSVFVARRDIRKRCARHGPRLVWASDLADTLSATMAAYVVGAAALSMAYSEAMYAIVMLMEVLRLHVIKEDAAIREATRLASASA
jgi:probable O-glycosylation ligase (exosortase A-associated)